MPQQISGDRVLLSTSEAMEKAGLSRVHIQRLLRTGQLEGMKLGHDWLVFEDSLMTFIAKPRKTGPKGPHKKSKQDTPVTSVNQDEKSDTNRSSTV
jgi:excisionase family DNA binding protein